MTAGYSAQVTTLLGYSSNRLPVKYLKDFDSFYDNGDQNQVYPFCHRYNGPRESFKFKSLADSINLEIRREIPIFNTAKTRLIDSTANLVWDESYIAQLYYFRTIIEFYEYLVSKSTYITWFN